MAWREVTEKAITVLVPHRGAERVRVNIMTATRVVAKSCVNIYMAGRRYLAPRASNELCVSLQTVQTQIYRNT